jgi:hypothetical protein
MNVTVVGSYESSDNRRLLGGKAKFQQACEVIGQLLAEAGHRLVVPHPDDESTAEHHALVGFRKGQSERYVKCFDHEGDPILKAHFDAVEKSDAVILIGGKNGTYAAGLGALRRRKQIIPIPAFGGSAKDLCEIPDIDATLRDSLRNLDIARGDWKARLQESVMDVLNAFPRLLIIHGRGDDGRALRQKIREESKRTTGSSVLRGIADPVIMNLSGKGAISVPDEFERLASAVDAAIAIVTADDIGGFAKLGHNETVSASNLRLDARARENVWVEVGWFWGRLGRGRVFLWLRDKLELPSDLQGAAWTSQKELDGAWESIEGFLSSLRSSDVLESAVSHSPTDGLQPKTRSNPTVLIPVASSASARGRLHRPRATKKLSRH